MKNLICFALALCALPLFGYTSPLASYEDYVFTRPVNTNRITGKLMGPEGDYSAMRTEDVAFIYEAVKERNAVIDGTYGGFSVSNKFVKGLKSGSFPIDYTNKYPWTVHDNSKVVAYYDTNVVTNVTAMLGIDTLWPKKLELTCETGWIDKDEKWPSQIEDATVKGSGDAAYTGMPITVVLPTYVNPQAKQVTSTTGVVQFVVWPLKRSVVEAYRFLARTEKFCAGKSLSSGGPTELVDTGQDTGTWLGVDLDSENEQATVETFQVDHRRPSTNRWSSAETELRFGVDLAMSGGVGGMYWSVAVDKNYTATFTGKTPDTEGPHTLNFTKSSEGEATAQYRSEEASDIKECIVDLGISKDVATTGVERIKTVDLYLTGRLKGGTNLTHRTANYPDIIDYPGANRTYGNDFGDVWSGGPAYAKNPDLYVVIPLLDADQVDIPHTNRVWNPDTGQYENKGVTYTLGVKFTPDFSAWSAKAFEIAGLPQSWGTLASAVVDDLADPSDDPPTPESIYDPGPSVWAWRSQRSSSHAVYELAFWAVVDRVVVTCDLRTKITESPD